MNICCVKCHSLDCIGCGSCSEYNMDDDGLVDETNDNEEINNEFDADPFEVFRN